MHITFASTLLPTARTLAAVAAVLLAAWSPAVVAEQAPAASVPVAGDSGAEEPFIFLPADLPGKTPADPKMEALRAQLAGPDATSAAAPEAKEDVPEPGTIGFGLAVLAIGLGKLVQSFVRAWRQTSAKPQ